MKYKIGKVKSIDDFRHDGELSKYLSDSYEEGYINPIWIPNGVKTIPARAFYDTKYILDIYLPDSVETIKEEAFYWMTSSTRIHFNENSNLKRIERASFKLSSENSILHIDIPKSIEYFHPSSFSDYYIGANGTINLYPKMTVEEWKNKHFYFYSSPKVIVYIDGKIIEEL